MVTFRLIFHRVFHHWPKALQMHKEYIDTQRIRIFFNFSKDPEWHIKSFLPQDCQLLWAKTVSQKMLVFSHVRWRRAPYLRLSLDFWLRKNFLSIWVTRALYRREKNSRKRNIANSFFVESTAVGIWLMFQSMKLGLNLSGECKIHWVFLILSGLSYEPSCVRAAWS